MLNAEVVKKIDEAVNEACKSGYGIITFAFDVNQGIDGYEYLISNLPDKVSRLIVLSHIASLEADNKMVISNKLKEEMN